VGIVGEDRAAGAAWVVTQFAWRWAIFAFRDAEWDAMKAVFLKKSPFEAPFFKYPTLRMMRVRPKRLSYAGADRVTFKAEF